MKVVCLGWGSLIWDPRELKISRNEWFRDGPELPIEFTRISSDNRITLIIDRYAEIKVPSLWAPMETEDIKDAIYSLKQREKITSTALIHNIQITEEPNNEITLFIKKWMEVKSVDAVIWTGLSYSKKTNFARPSVDDLKIHLRNLSAEDFNKAKEYITNAPSQIITRYRNELEDEIDMISRQKYS